MTWRNNRLLAAFPPAFRDQRLFKAIFMPLDEVVSEPARPVDRIVFPTSAVFAVSSVMADGRENALTLVGREGLSDIDSFLGGGLALCRTVVIRAGWGYQVSRDVLDEECRRSAAMRGMLLRYAKSYLAQVAQTTVCNRHHSIDRQLCRWLLMMLERQSSSAIHLTQDRLAELLGVRRESISVATHALASAGLIRKQRACISVVDRPGVEARSCECHEMLRRHTDFDFAFTPAAVAAAAPAKAERPLRIVTPQVTPQANVAPLGA